MTAPRRSARPRLLPALRRSLLVLGVPLAASKPCLAQATATQLVRLEVVPTKLMALGGSPALDLSALLGASSGSARSVSVEAVQSYAVVTDAAGMQIAAVCDRDSPPGLTITAHFSAPTGTQTAPMTLGRIARSTLMELPAGSRSAGVITYTAQASGASPAASLLPLDCRYGLLTGP